ncbi:MAG: LPS export ABC transporter permease LptF [Paracoccaceae bacterium]
MALTSYSPAVTATDLARHHSEDQIAVFPGFKLLYRRPKYPHARPEGAALSKFDRYVLSQLLVLFGFFSLILVAVLWINKAVSLFDRLIGDGQSALVFLEFSALGLPSLISILMPAAAFAAAIYITNRLNNESELTVMQATGSSPWRLARPVVVFGLFVGIMLSLLTHFLVPTSRYQLSVREAEISKNITSRLLTEGTFLHPSYGVTFYIGKIEPDGTLNNVFLSDRRNPARAVTYTAANAFLVREGEAAKLIMVDGLAQAYVDATQRLSTTNFSDFSYDISELNKGPTTPNRSEREIPTPEILRAGDDIAELTDATPVKVLREVHARFAAPFFCVATALIGFSTLLLGGYSRFGVWRQIGLALAVLIALEMLRGAAIKAMDGNIEFWPLMYAPSALGIGISAAFLFKSARPGLFRFRPSQGAA